MLWISIDLSYEKAVSVIMIQDKEKIDVLLVENSTAIIDLFKVLTKKFDLTIKFVENTAEFVEIIKKYDFLFVLCDLNLDYKLEGLFISQIYASFRKIKNLEGKNYLFTSDPVINFDFSKYGFDDCLPKNFQSIYQFLREKFPFRSFHDLITDKIEYCVFATI